VHTDVRYSHNRHRVENVWIGVEDCRPGSAPRTTVYGLPLGLQALRSMAMRYDCSRISGL